MKFNMRLIPGIYMHAARSDELDAQRRVCLKFIEQQAEFNIGDVVEEYVDAPKFEITYERPALARLLADAEAGRFNMLVVSDGTRLAHDAQLLVQLLLDMTAFDVSVVFANERFCTDPALHAKLFMHSSG